VTADELAKWMQNRLTDQKCVYQDESVDVAIKAKAEHLYRINDDGNIVLGKDVLAAFKKLNATTAVWVKPDRYWRWRCSTDEPGREQRG
jgi:hypothetical protein